MTDLRIVPASGLMGLLTPAPTAAAQRASQRAARRAAAASLERRRRLSALQQQVVALQAAIGQLAGTAARLEALEAARPLTTDEKHDARRATYEQRRLALELQRIAAELRALPAVRP